MSDLSTEICGVSLKNPVIAASGTFGFGREVNWFFPIEKLGAVAVKGLTLQPRPGNPPPRVAETPAGMLNSVGLLNPGVDAFIEEELPWLSKKVPVIANINGNTVEEYCRVAEKLRGKPVSLLELNISCPNVKQGGVHFGTDPAMVREVVSAVKSVSAQPLIVKLTPNVTDIAEMAIAACEGGADALSLINTLLGLAIDAKTKRPVLGNVLGGLSGPAVKPVALRMVWQVSRAVTVPIIGMGGIMTGEDAVEFFLAGASAVMVGTATIADPMAALRIVSEMDVFIDEHGGGSVRDWVGALLA
jgi:dihydroorotate dehydrogenase (NAD+) catalytic subunit